MAMIEVNRRALVALAQSIEKYRDVYKKEMLRADMAVQHMLAADWKGDDANAFAAQWAAIRNSGSISSQLDKALEDYANALRQCDAIYEKAQQDALNEAKKINSHY